MMPMSRLSRLPDNARINARAGGFPGHPFQHQPGQVGRLSRFEQGGQHWDLGVSGNDPELLADEEPGRGSSSRFSEDGGQPRGHLLALGNVAGNTADVLFKRYQGRVGLSGVVGFQLLESVIER